MSRQPPRFFSRKPRTFRSSAASSVPAASAAAMARATRSRSGRIVTSGPSLPPDPPQPRLGVRPVAPVACLPGGEGDRALERGRGLGGASLLLEREGELVVQEGI